MVVDPSIIDLANSVRRFAIEFLRPLERQMADVDQLPPAAKAAMADMGLFGLSVPEEYGGLGLSMMAEVEVVMAITQASPAFRSAFGTNVGIGSQGLVMFGTEKQKQAYLPNIATGELITSFALTEPDTGSDAAHLSLAATKTKGGYLLNGQKAYITNADVAGLFTVMARTNPNVTGAGGVSAFLVPAGCNGLNVGPCQEKMGQQGAHICDLFFNDCFVADDQMLGAPGEGFKVAMAVLDRGRLHMAAVCTGVAERLLAASLEYGQSRQQFGKPIVEHQMIAAMLANGETEFLAARALVRDVAAAFDRGEKVTKGAAAAKLFASEMVGRMADAAVQIHGGAGYVADFGIERLYRDVRIFRIYEGTSEIMRQIIAKEMVRERPI